MEDKSLEELKAQLEELTKANEELTKANEDLTKTNEEQKAYTTRVKNSMDRALSETAQFKRELRSKQTEEEQRAAEIEEANRKRDEEYATLKANFEKLESEKKLAEDTKKFMSLGLEDKVADKCAKAQSNGNLDEVLSCIKAHYETKMNEQKAEWMNGRPDPQVGGEPNKESDPFLAGFNM